MMGGESGEKRKGRREIREESEEKTMWKREKRKERMMGGESGEKRKGRREIREESEEKRK